MTEQCLTGHPPYSCPGADLSGVDLAGKDLSHADLSGANLTGTRFAGVVSLAGANLTGATMGKGTDFSGCDLTTTVFGQRPHLGSDPARPTRFVGATVPYAVLGSTWRFLNLSGATIVGMPTTIEFFEVTECTISGIDFSKMTLRNAHFASVVARGARFTDATLDEVVFGRESETPTDLTGAKLAGAKIPNGVFDTATLTSADLNGATLDHATFLNARMDGTIFDRTNITTCAFSSPPRWSEAPGNNTSFRGATLNHETIGLQWSFLDLTGATVVGLDPSIDLSELQARYAVLTGLNLSGGYTIKASDFSGATIAGVDFTGATMSQSLLLGVQGEKPVFDRAVLTGARFDPIRAAHGQTGPQPTKMPGASFRGAHLDGASMNGANLSPAGTAESPIPTTFVGATLERLTATGADLTGAQMSGGIVMHGANFTGATLKGADMTGAMLGALGNLFTMPKGAADYATLLNALASSTITVVAKVFGQHGVSLPPDETSVHATVPGQAWQVKVAQATSQTTYTVLLVTAADGTQSLQAFGVATAGRGYLSNAFMPDAILTDANLISVDAHGVQLFSISAQKQLAGAVLFQIDLTNAILGSDVAIDMSETQLFHATLTGAFLVNAKLANANLTGVDLDDAQLQGANFTDAAMPGGVVLTNAAVSTRVHHDAEGDLFGVYLFGVSSSEAETQRAVAELTAAAHPLLNLATDGDGSGDYATLISQLDAGKLEAIQAAFQAHGVTLSAGSSIQLIERDAESGTGIAWSVHDPTAATGKIDDYTVWAGFDPLGDNVLVARPSLPTVQRLFATGYQVQLRPQTTVTARNASKRAMDDGIAWVVDNDSTNPNNLGTGYVQFLIRHEPETDTLAVYGTLIHATRLQHAGQQELVPITFQATTLCKTTPCNDDGSDTYLQPDTVCPNGIALSVNQRQRISFAEMLRAEGRPPQPPTCVPSPYASCPSS